MNRKTGLTVAASLLLALAGTSLVQASSWAEADSDYAQLSVPDMGQAVSFFENVMGCARLSSAEAPAASTLLECANDRVLELFPASNGHVSSSPPVQFRSSDLRSASAAVRSHHLRTIEHAPQRGVEAVEFLTPWGQRIELVGRSSRSPGTRSAPAAARVASH